MKTTDRRKKMGLHRWRSRSAPIATIVKDIQARMVWDEHRATRTSVPFDNTL